MSNDGARLVVERRRNFVDALYALNWALGQNSPAAAQARQKLARLRRSFAGPQHEVEGYSIIFPYDPPPSEQKVWLLVAGLFALHPQEPAAQRRSIGGAMRLLAAKNSDAARRRMEQLLSVDAEHLPHYLRQAVTLLRSADIAFDYHRLLADLVDLLRNEFTSDKAHAVRLRWARDFYRPEPKIAPAGRSDTPAAPVETVTT